MTESMSGEMAWLIERRGQDGRALWWDGQGWSTVADRAVRYARKADAERVIRCEAFCGASATEHEWVPPPAPPAPNWRAG